MKFIKDIIGEQRGRLSPETVPEPVPEPVQEDQPAVAAPSQDIDPGDLSFLRLEPSDRVPESEVVSELSAVQTSDVDRLAALNSLAEVAEDVDPEVPAADPMDIGAPHTLERMVQDTVEALVTETVTHIAAPDPEPEPVPDPEPAEPSADLALAPEPELEMERDPFATLQAETQSAPTATHLTSAEPTKRIFRRRKPDDQPTAAAVAPEPAPTIDVPPPMPGRSADFARTEAPAMPLAAASPPTSPARAGRVKTRLLGFGQQPDPLASSTEAPAAEMTRCPVGWIAVVDGPGRGATFALGNGVGTIGRGAGQSLQLDFGDTSISRENHASLAYDPETRGFYLGHGGKANLVRLNGRPVLSTETLRNGDEIRLGETRLRFVALCGESFDWGDATATSAVAEETPYPVHGDGLPHALSR